MSIWTKILPGSVQRQIAKNWIPLGNGFSDAKLGMGEPVWLALGQENFIDKGFMYNPAVYSIVSYLTRLGAQIPWTLYKVKDAKWLNRYKGMDPTDTIRANLYEKKGLEAIESSRILDIWDRPNSLQGQSEFIEQMYGYKLVTGNTYIHGISPETGPNAGLFTELNVLPAQLIGIEYGGPMSPVSHYYWKGDPSRRIDPAVVMHSKYWNPKPLNAGGLYGLSPLTAGSRLITRNNDSLTASVKALQNMGAIGMLSKYVGAAGEKGLTPEQAEMIERKYYEKYGGAENRGRIMVTGAAVKWQQMAMSPTDLNILEQEKIDLRTMCGIYGLPSQLLGDPDNRTYNTMKEAKTAGYTQAVIPGLRSIRDEINRWWIAPWSKRDGVEYWMDLDLQAVPELQLNYKELMEWLKEAESLTINEKRAVMQYEPLDQPGTDEIWIDSNKITLSQAMEDASQVDKYLGDKL